MSQMQNSDVSHSCIAVLSAINKHYATFGVPPTIRYIMGETNVKSTSTIFYFYRRLVKLNKLLLIGCPGSDYKPIPIPLYEHIKEFYQNESN